MKLERFFRHYIGALLCLLASLWLGATADAATYYVAKTGNNSRSCASATNVATAKQTINAGLRCLLAGDTLIIKAGTYNEYLTNTIPAGLSWARPVTLQAAPGETVILQPQADKIILRTNRAYIRVEGLILDGSRLTRRQVGAIKIDDGAHHITFHNVETRNIRDSCIQVNKSTTNITLSHMKIHGCNDPQASTGSHGIYWVGQEGVIEDSEIYNVSGYGIQIYSATGVPVRNNIVRNNRLYNVNTRAAVVLGGSAENTLFYNNIIYNCKVGFQYGGRNTRVYNNTFYNIARGINAPRGTYVWKNNIFYRVGGAVPAGNLTSDPRFVDAPDGNFRLRLPPMPLPEDVN